MVPTLVCRTTVCVWVIRPSSERWELVYYSPDGDFWIIRRCRTPQEAVQVIVDGDTEMDAWDKLPAAVRCQVDNDKAWVRAERDTRQYY